MPSKSKSRKSTPQQPSGLSLTTSMTGNDTATMNDQSDQTTSEFKQQQHEIDNQQNNSIQIAELQQQMKLLIEMMTAMKAATTSTTATTATTNTANRRNDP